MTLALKRFGFRVVGVLALKRLKFSSSTKILRTYDTKKKKKRGNREIWGKYVQNYIVVLWGSVNTPLEGNGWPTYSFVKLSSHLYHERGKPCFQHEIRHLKEQAVEWKVCRINHRSIYQTFFIASEQKMRRVIKCSPCPQLTHFYRTSPKKTLCMFWAFSKEDSCFSNDPSFQTNAAFMEN